MHTLMWEALQWPGIEYFAFTENEKGKTATGILNGVENQQPFALRYDIEITPDWKVSSFLIQSLADRGRQFRLVSDLEGHWFDKSGNHITAFDGCMDIDISLTPFTNTLPVKRLSWAPGERRSLNMLYIKLPEFELQQVVQHYTCINKQLYHYENTTSAFETDIPFDSMGFVTDYPPRLFRRIWG